MLLWRFLDVPDAPENLVLSEHKSKSVKLKWIPGDDHNSSTTGKEESLWAAVKIQDFTFRPYAQDKGTAESNYDASTLQCN